MKSLKRITMILSLLCVFQCIVTARSLDRVILNNGTVYEGRISKQVPGESMTIKVDKAEVWATDTNKIEVTNREFVLDELTEEWVQWAENQPGVIKVRGGKKYITLSDVRCISSKMNVNMVRVLERGDTAVRYLSFPRNQDRVIETEDIVKIDRLALRSSLDLSGLEDEIFLKGSQSIKGQIISQNLKEANVKFLDNDGVVHIIKVDDIVKTTKYRMNENQDIFEQSPILDQIYLKQTAGDYDIIGVIVTQAYGDKPEDNYMVVQTARGEVRLVKNAEIKEIVKLENIKYNIKKDVLIEDNELNVCGETIDSITVVINEKGDFILPNETQAVIFKNTIINGELIIVMKGSVNADKLVVLPVKENIVSKKKKVLGFSYKDIVESSINSTQSFITKNGNTHKMFKVKEGKYVIINRNTKMYYLIEIK